MGNGHLTGFQIKRPNRVNTTHRTCPHAVQMTYDDVKRVVRKIGFQDDTIMRALLDTCQECFDRVGPTDIPTHIAYHLTPSERRARRMFLRGW